jgi:tetratricopeptide (TPR) repeat protein
MNIVRWLVCVLSIGAFVGTAGAEKAGKPGTKPGKPASATIELHVTPPQGYPEADKLERKGLRSYAEGKSEKAAEYFVAAVDAMEKEKNPDPAVLARKLSNLAWFYQSQGRTAEAEALLKRALAAGEKAHGPKAVEIAPGVEELGLFYLSAGRYADATPYLDRSMALYTAKGKTNSPDIARNYDHLGLISQATGDAKKSEAYFEQALAGMDSSRADTRRSRARVLMNLAWLYHDEHRYPESRKAFLQAIELSDQIMRDEHVSNGHVFGIYPVLLIRGENVIPEAEEPEVEAKVSK